MFFKKKLIKKYREKIRKIKKRCDEKIQNEKNKFASILLHDIKTPLLAQNQTLGLLFQGKFGELSDFQKEITEQILNSNNFLLDVVSNTIFLTKYENSKPNLENVDIIEQIEDCCEIIKTKIQNKNQNIIIKKNKNIKLNADKKLIKKIIYNLISGSVSFAFENSDIEISVRENKKSIQFCAKNKSIYMTKEKIKSLFEDKKNLYDFNQLGMNLNLNIAKKLINAHNWKIIAKSDKNNSCEFGFVITK